LTENINEIEKENLSDEQVVAESGDTKEITKESIENLETEVVTNEVVAEDSTSDDKAVEATAPEVEEKVETAHVEDGPLVHNPDDFDWSVDKEGFARYEDSQQTELENLYSDTFKSVEEKTVVDGTIVSMTKKDVVVNIGFKSDGIVGRTEFRATPDLKVGDVVKVYVEKTEDALGQLILSHKRAVSENAWENIQKAKEENTIVTGFVKSRTKGGLVVDLMGMDAFLPGSQIDVKPIRDYDIYVGQTMEFKVVKINELFKNVVISHKALIEDDIEAQKGEILSSLEEGQVLEGVVKNMTSFGVFVDLGGLDGLLHITDISWGRINHPEEVLSLDEKINVVVLEFDDDKKRISLGLKQLTPHPWDTLDENIKEGSMVKGKVVTVADYGAFVEIQPGIEGLVHVSEMSWSQHLRNPGDFMKVGDEIEAKVLSFDKEEHKMSLGIKQLTEDPWLHINTKYDVGSKHTGVVRNLTNYGLFVELEQGVDGLVHVSDLSWSKKIKHPAEFINKGEELEIIVLEIDNENRRLSLGHKQLDENPWDTFETVFYEGSEHTGTVTELGNRGATVGLPYGVEGFVPTKHMKMENDANMAVDQELAFRVVEFNKDQKRVILSHTNIWKGEEIEKQQAEKTEKVRQAKKTTGTIDKMNKGTERGTLGDLEGLAALKAKMDAAASAPTAKKEAKAEPKKKVEKKAEKKETAKPEKVAKAKAEVKEEVSTDDAGKTLLSKIGKGDAKKADDLKLISGVGPVFEKTLNGIGIYNFAQIAKMTKAEYDILDGLTGKFPGRAERDDWAGQAKTLAE
jgi:small subunit ribosomal protein S1